jgi:phage terminase large subunit
LQKFYRSTDAEIIGENGTQFLFAGLRTHVDSIKSTEGIDRAWVEEAHNVAQTSLDILIPTIRKPGSELLFTWNPRHSTDPVDAMFRGAVPPPDAMVRQVSWRDNPWFPDVLRPDMEWDLKRDPQKYAHIWGGEYLKNSGSQVFTNWRVGSEADFKPAIDQRFYYGGDWGFSTDPTVLVRSYIEGRTLFVDYEAHAIGCEIDRTPELFAKVPGANKWPIIADSARPETISYMRRNGYPMMRGAKKGAGSVEEGVEFLKSYDIVVHPRCVHVVDELTLYSYKADKVTGDVLPILEDKQNHCIDALRYSLEGAMRGKEWTVA